MERIVERLYRDRLDLQTADYPYQPEYQKAMKRWESLNDKLMEEMGQEFADALGDAQMALEDWCSISWFEKGIRLGAQLMMEMLESV